MTSYFYISCYVAILLHKKSKKSLLNAKIISQKFGLFKNNSYLCGIYTNLLIF